MSNQPQGCWTHAHFASFLGIALSGLLARTGLYSPSHVGYFWQDTGRDYCVKPFDFANGMPIWANDTAMPFYWLVHNTNVAFGLSGTSVFVINNTLFVLGLYFLCGGLVRLSTPTMGLTSVGLLQLHYPFIAHNIYLTAIMWGFLPFGIAIWLLSQRKSYLAMALLGVAGALSLFSYPGATLVLVFFIMTYVLFHEKPLETLKQGIIIGGTFVATITVLKKLWTPSQSTQWAGGNFTLHSFSSNLSTMIKDTFVHGTSWNLVSSGIPYFHWGGLIFLLALVYYSWGSLTPPYKKTVAAIFLTATLTLLINGFISNYPGARRIIYIFPLIIWAIAMLVAPLDSQRRRIAIAVSAMLLMIQSYFSYKTTFPLIDTADEFIVAAITRIDQEDEADFDVLIDRMDHQATAEFFRCRLAYQFFQGKNDNTLVSPLKEAIEPISDYKYLIGKENEIKSQLGPLLDQYSLVLKHEKYVLLKDTRAP